MPWPTNPSEPYFGRGLWGWVSDTWVKLLSTAAGALHVHIMGVDSALLVTQTLPQLLTSGIHGYDGSAWRKLPLLWGYSDVYGESVGDTNLSAGTNSLNGSVVPSGEVWVVRGVLAMTISGSVSNLYFYATIGGSDITLRVDPTPTSGVWCQFLPVVYLKAGDKVFVQVTGATAGDDLYARFWGYKMAVA